MTLRDTYRITLHTMRGNKPRCVLTVVIAAFLSILIMGMVSLAISFSENSKAMLNQAYFGEDAFVSVEWSNKRELLTADQPTFDESYYAPFCGVIEDYSDVVDVVRYKTNLSAEMDFVDPRFDELPGIYIREGRNVAPSEKSNEIIVSLSAYEQSLERQPEDVLSVGSTHLLPAFYLIRDENRKEQTIAASLECVVVGIYETTAERNVVINGKKDAFSYQNAIGDIGLAFSLRSKDICVESARLYHRSQGEANDPSGLINRVNSLKTAVNDTLPQALSVEIFSVPGNPPERIERYHDGAVCPSYEALMQNNAIRYIVIGIALLFAGVLLIISIGSLVNSVIISIDGSKKFIGLLKALGMRNRSLALAIVMEMVTLITAGVLIGYLLLLSLIAPLGNLISAIMGFAYSAYAEILVFSASFSTPIYVFFGALAVFLLLVYLFSKGALHKAIKSSPIEVINEVS